MGTPFTRAKTTLDFRRYRKNIPTAVKASAIPTPGAIGFERGIAQQTGQVGVYCMPLPRALHFLNIVRPSGGLRPV